MEAVTSNAVIGQLPSGEAVEGYELTGAGGLSVRIISFGATVTHLLVPDRHGRLADVVLGFSDWTGYLQNPAYLGATVGRVAGRIGGGRLTIDGQPIELDRNEKSRNHLHGGYRGFNQRVWAATLLNPQTLRLSRNSPAGEERYPGSVDVSVTFTVTDDNRLAIEVDAATDRTTPFSLTNHSYFNLAGEGSGTIEDHTLQIFADRTAVVDESWATIGKAESVDGRPWDLRQPARLREAIPRFPDSHGELYFINRSSGRAFVPAARLTHPPSGRVMSVSTTETCVQVYTANYFDGSMVGKSGQAYGSLAGLCLECEGFPGGIETSALGDILLRPGRPLHHRTEYAFTNLA